MSRLMSDFDVAGDVDVDLASANRQVLWKGRITSCDNCATLEDDLGHVMSFCQGCQVAKYCSTACQKAGWKDGGHKTKCPRMKTQRAISIAHRSHHILVENAPSREQRARQWVSNYLPDLLMIAMRACLYPTKLQLHACFYIKCITEQPPANEPGDTNPFLHILPASLRSGPQEFYVAELHLLAQPVHDTAPVAPSSLYVHTIGGTGRLSFDIPDDALELLRPSSMLPFSELIKYFNRGVGWYFVENVDDSPGSKLAWRQ